MLEINLIKLDRGTKTEWKTVRRGGKTFKQRFRTGKKDVTPAPGSTMTKDNLVEMVPAYDTAPGDEITGTLHEGGLYRCKFKDGSHGLHKPLVDVDIVGETSYYDVSEILGFDICPETVKVDFGEGEGSCQRWVPDGKNVVETGVHKEDLEQLAQIFVTDIVCGNRDRHDENIMKTEDGKWHAIDNEMWGSMRPQDDWMDALDEAIGTDYSTIYCPQMTWMNEYYESDNKTEDLKLFKQYVIDGMKSVLEHEDEIKQSYERHLDSHDVDTRKCAGSVMYALEYIKEYTEDLQ